MKDRRSCLHDVIPRAGGESIHTFAQASAWIPRINRGMTIFVCSLLFVTSGLNAAPPAPPQKTQSLEILQNKIEEEKAQQAKLSKQAKEAEKEIAAGKSKIIDLTANIRKNEDAQRALEKNVQELTTQEESLAKKLELDRGSMATTILGLERMRRVPPELLIVRPGAPLETAQTAMLLGNLLPALNQRAQKLSEDIEKLHQVQTKLADDRKSLLVTKADLDKQNSELSKMMAAREKEFKTANSAYRASASRAEQYAVEAKSLAELVARIEEDNKRTATLARDRADEERPAPAPRKKSSSGGKKAIKGLGKAIWPVNGRTIAQFGDQDEMGGAIKGIKIDTSAKAVVVTPLAGTVKYAGTFRNYGQLVIVEHNNGYHSLLAGLSRADVATGQSLNGGEPLGYMPGSSSQNGPLTLYYELRHDGEAIDPSNLFSELKS